jgi:hypothetical protein
MTGADKGFQKRLCKKRMWKIAGELMKIIVYCVGFGYEIDNAKGERWSSLWHRPLRGVMAYMGLVGRPKAGQAVFADRGLGR